jgi:hypothetical protein
MGRMGVLGIAAMLAAGGQMALVLGAFGGPRDEMIARHAATNSVPERLVRRVIRIESRGNPKVVSKGNYGLMQIRLGTARAMGYRGTAEGLLDAETNLTYAVRYLAGAYRAARCNEDRAVAYYQRGYYGTRQVKCSVPHPAPQVVKAETDASAPPDSDTVAAADVLKPRVVHTEHIVKERVAAAPRSAKFDPVRISASQASPDATGADDKSVAAGSSPQGALQTVARLDVASVPLPRQRPAPAPEVIPLPPVKPEFTPESPATAQADHHPRHRHRHAARHRKAAEPIGLLAALKKLVTPDKKTRRSH